MQGYRGPNWAAFRRRIIALHLGRCSVCGRTAGAGVILQVHHKHYLPGHKLWEYPDDMCDVLCKGCHAAEHGIVPPRFGWTFMDCEDLGSVDGECDLCGNDIRYVFSIHHPRWGVMEVGTNCCDNLTSSQVANGIMDSHRRHVDRCKRFVNSPRWKAESPGARIIQQDGVTVAVVSSQGHYRIKVGRQHGRLSFATEVEARVKVFELLESKTLQAYYQKQMNRALYGR